MPLFTVHTVLIVPTVYLYIATIHTHSTDSTYSTHNTTVAISIFMEMQPIMDGHGFGNKMHCEYLPKKQYFHFIVEGILTIVH